MTQRAMVLISQNTFIRIKANQSSKRGYHETNKKFISSKHHSADAFAGIK
jgi:hypothetical protein